MRSSLIIAALVLSSPVAAKPNVSEDKLARLTAERFARCVVKKHHDMAVDFVIQRPDPEEDPRALSVLDPGCLELEGSLSMPMLVARAALAEVLIKQDFPNDNISDFSAVAPLIRPPVKQPPTLDKRGRTLKPKQLKAVQEAYQMTQAFAELDAIAECVVRAEANGVRAVLASKIVSEDERNTLHLLSPVINRCAIGKPQYTYLREPLRGALAVAYYELLMASKGRTRKVAWHFRVQVTNA